MWDTTGTHGMIAGTTLHGRTTFGWHESGAYLVMRSEIHEDVGVPAGTGILGSDPDHGTYGFAYYDERGVSRLYSAAVDGRVVTWWRDAPGFAQRTTLTIAADGRTMTGRGELCRDGSTWEQDLDLTYTRVDG